MQKAILGVLYALLHDRDEALRYNKENLLNPFFIVRRD